MCDFDERSLKFVVIVVLDVFGRRRVVLHFIPFSLEINALTDDRLWRRSRWALETAFTRFPQPRHLCLSTKLLDLHRYAVTPTCGRLPVSRGRRRSLQAKACRAGQECLRKAVTDSLHTLSTL